MKNPFDFIEFQRKHSLEFIIGIHLNAAHFYIFESSDSTRTFEKLKYSSKWLNSGGQIGAYNETGMPRVST